MKAKLVKESLYEEELNEKWFKRDGPLITMIMNFLMATVGTGVSLVLYKSLDSIVWGIIAAVMFGFGGFGMLIGAIGETDYFEWINDLEDWVKSRKYSTEKGQSEIEEKIEEVKNAVLNSPQISRGQKANITRIQNDLKRAIKRKNWREVRYLLEDLQATMNRYRSDK
jgi:hypothetical protein